MISDQPSRDRALDPCSSLIVQAPAGSGKTELLIQRYLRLLSTVEHPETIVAITFTKKAAGEMRARVMHALRNAATGAKPTTPHELVTLNLAREVLDRDRQAGWGLLENPSRMRIQTIDALCAYITRQMPWLAGFGAQPEISEKPEDLYREAARNTLSEVQEEERRGEEGPISTVLLHLDNDFKQAERLMAQMLEKRDQWLRHTGSPNVRSEIEEALTELVQRNIADLHSAFPEEVLHELVSRGSIPSVPGPKLEDRPIWHAITELLLTKAKAWRKANEHLIRPEQREHLLEALRGFCRLPPTRFEDSQWLAMEAVIQLLPRAVAQLQLVFRDRGRVDFAELSIRTSWALGEIEAPSDLALSLGYRLEHLLVDEFQDTSYTQYELLRKLTAGWEPADGRTLFLVGDPMQSIYRFRQADVSLFLKARNEGIGSVLLNPLTLEANFRSSPAIVNWVNQTFREMFPAQEHVDIGAVAYSASVAQRAEKISSEIRVHPFLGESQAEEADRVISLIDGRPNGSIGILVRARSHLVAIVRALRARRIAFQAIEIDQLGDRPVIQDLLALTFALLHPADRVSWLAILRAPWCGLEIKDLHALASGDTRATIFDLLHASELPREARARVARILPVLESALKQRGRTGLRNLVEQTWVRLGGPAGVDSDSAFDDAAAYFDLIEGLERSGDLGDFQALRDQVKALFAQPDSRADGRLQVMTIHKAKGLEFDTVILPGLGQTARRDDAVLLLWSEQGGKLLLAPIAEQNGSENQIYKYLERHERKKSEHETTRLLYVAATRARSELHLLGCANFDHGTREVTPQAGSFLALLWSAVHSQFTAASKKNQGQVTAGAPRPVVSEDRLLYRVPATWTVPPPPPAISWRRGAGESIEPPETTYEWVGDGLRHAGTVVHAYLLRIAREGLNAWSAGAIAAHREQYRAMLTYLGVPSSEVQQTCERVEAGLVRAVRDPRGQWVLGPHAEAECEYPITGLIDEKICQAVIDRTFVDEAGVRWIIDYKTSLHEGGDIENFLDAEKQRYQEQLERYSRLIAHSESRPIRLALYFPLLNGWREWAAPTVKRRQASLFDSLV